jgi:hypothetical protein
VWVNYRDRDNYLHRLAGQQGESLKDLLVRAQLMNNDELCISSGDFPHHGKPRRIEEFHNLKCFQCGVVVEEPWFSRIEGTEDRSQGFERLQLQRYHEPHRQARCACMIEVLPELNGIEIRYMTEWPENNALS